MSAQARHLAQSRPSGTTAAALLTVASAAKNGIEITRLVIANTTASSAKFSVYHDDDGTTYDQTTALYYSVAISANTTTVIEAQSENSGITISPGGALAVQTDTGSALTFTLYGVVGIGR